MIDDAVQSIEERREKLGVSYKNFSAAAGYTKNAWHNIVSYGQDYSERALEAHEAVLDYKEEHGILPEPGDVEP